MEESQLLPSVLRTQQSMSFHVFFQQRSEVPGCVRLGVAVGREWLCIQSLTDRSSSLTKCISCVCPVLFNCHDWLIADWSVTYKWVQALVAFHVCGECFSDVCNFKHFLEFSSHKFESLSIFFFLLEFCFSRQTEESDRKLWEIGEHGNVWCRLDSNFWCPH